MTLPALPSDIRDLPVPERVALAEQIWESVVEDESQFHLTAAQKAELDRRLTQRNSLPSSGSSWSDVKGRIQKDS